VTIRANISGIQATRAVALSTIAALRPDSAFGVALRDAVLMVDRYAAQITKVKTGSWRASHRPAVDGLHGSVTLDPNAVNPKSGTRPAVYGAQWEDRGGEHAVYARTVNEAGQRILDETGIKLYRSLP
jgi:hypothetical protein